MRFDGDITPGYSSTRYAVRACVPLRAVNTNVPVDYR